MIENSKLLSDEDLMLTTVDNPYNPKTDYSKWYIWDMDNGYRTQQFIARLVDEEARESDVDIDDENDAILNQITTKVIQDILEHDMTRLYVLV
jgi:hypothetical protein